MVSDCAKIKKLSWKPKISISKGLQLTPDWYTKKVGMILFAEDCFSSYVKNVFGLISYQESITQDFFVASNNKDQ